MASIPGTGATLHSHARGPEIRRVADRLAGAGRPAGRARALRAAAPQAGGRPQRPAGARGRAPGQGAAHALRERALALLPQPALRRLAHLPGGQAPNLGRSLRVALETADRWACTARRTSRSSRSTSSTSTPSSRASVRTCSPATDAPASGDACATGASQDAAWVPCSSIRASWPASATTCSETLLHRAAPRGNKDLDDETVALLARQIREVTRRSYRTGGITELPDEVREAKRLGSAAAASATRSSGARASPVGDTAPDRRGEVGTRRLCLCPHCQPSRRRRA